MKASTPVDVALQEITSGKRAKALASIERTRPLSLLTQQIELWFALLMILGVAAVAMLKPTIDSTPYIALMLVLAISAIAGHAMQTQRRLEALIVLVKQDLPKS